MKVTDTVEKRLYTALYLQHASSDQSLEQCRNYSANTQEHAGEGETESEV